MTQDAADEWLCQTAVHSHFTSRNTVMLCIWAIYAFFKTLKCVRFQAVSVSALVIHVPVLVSMSNFAAAAASR